MSGCSFRGRRPPSRCTCSFRRRCPRRRSLRRDDFRRSDLRWIARLWRQPTLLGWWLAFLWWRPTVLWWWPTVLWWWPAFLWRRRLRVGRSLLENSFSRGGGRRRASSCSTSGCSFRGRRPPSGCRFCHCYRCWQSLRRDNFRRSDLEVRLHLRYAFICVCPRGRVRIVEEALLQLRSARAASARRHLHRLLTEHGEVRALAVKAAAALQGGRATARVQRAGCLRKATTGRR